MLFQFLSKEPKLPLVIAKAKEIADNLKAKGFSVVLDDREEYTPGWKFNQWELKGVPVRVEIGPRDLKQGQVVMVRRDTGQKAPVKEAEIPETAEKLLQEIQENLFSKAKALMQEKTSNCARATRSSRRCSVTKAAF